MLSLQEMIAFGTISMDAAALLAQDCRSQAR
jgi:hypothetical protein